jgi:transcription-repair coupling factor (superfamily II helicase)
MQEALEELKDDENFEKLFENEEDRKKLFKSTKDVNIDTDMELMFPDSYISSIEERLTLYQKLSELTNEDDLLKYESELIDRFGNLPAEVINLLKSVSLKWLAAEIGFEKIVMKKNVFLGYFPSNPQDKFYTTDKFRRIIQYLTQNPVDAQLKEKATAEGMQLMMRKDNVENVDEVNAVLKKILAS